MPRLNKREHLLVLTFSSLVVIAVIVVAYNQSKKWWDASKQEQQLLAEQIQTAEFWLDQRDEYNAKQKWLNENLNPMTSRNEATSEFLSFLQAAAEKYAMEIKQQTIMDPENNEPIVKIRLVVSAPIKPFIQWINEVQQPAQLIAAPEIEVKAIPKSDNLNISIVMVKYFKAS